jgi:hypothetical protein
MIVRKETQKKLLKMNAYITKKSWYVRINLWELSLKIDDLKFYENP